MDPEEIKRALALAAAKQLLQLAVYFQSQHTRRLNTSAGPKSVKRQRNTVAGRKGSRRTIYTRPSRPGEYPHKRTGFGQASVQLDTDDVATIAQRQVVRVGYLENADYMGILEVYKNRKGLSDTMQELQPQLAALMGKGG